MSEEVEKLQEVSVSLTVVHYLALKGMGAAQHKSLSRVIRESIYDLLEGELEVYGDLLAQHGHSIKQCTRDDEELGKCAKERHSPSTFIIDAMLDAVDLLMIEVPVGKLEQKVTINVSLSPTALQIIKNLCKSNIYVSQSEFLRRGIADYLSACVWPSVVPSQSSYYER